MDAGNLFSVKDKVVLVTGGSRGIGKMIATGFVQSGAKVYISSRSASACQETADELNKLGPGKCEIIPADMQSADECRRLAEELGKREKCLHVLVQNAGANWGAPIDEFPDDGFTKVMNLNVQRVFTLTQALIPLLSRGARATASSTAQNYDSSYSGPWVDPARIIHIGSIDGLRVPNLDTFSYSASKAALHHLSRVLAVKLSERGITSNTLACGPFQSKMMAATLESFGDMIAGANPLQRIGTPEDVAGACLFLSSRAGAYVNGALITLDGGSVLGSRL